MFEPFAKKPADKSTTPIPEVVTIEIPEDALHVMPTQYQGTPVPAAKRPKAPKTAGTSNPNRKFFLLIGGLAIILGAIVAGFYFYAQFFPTTPTTPATTNTNTQRTNTEPSTPTDTAPDITTAVGRDAQRIKDITVLQVALAAYQGEFKMYPQIISAIPATYLIQEPKDPLSTQPYAYTVTTGGANYAIQFVIESQAIFNGQVLAAGVHAVGPTGLLADGQIPSPTATSTVPVVPSQPSTDNVDSDQDGLTTVEEQSFKTDAQNPDTDGDGYKDGDEINRLYSPLAGAGAFLNTSGLVKAYTNTKFNYSLWVVQDWIVRSADDTDREITLTAPTGDAISILAEPKDAKQTLEQWYTARHSDVPTTQIRKLQIGGLTAIKSPDGLAVYVTNGTTIFSMAYDPAGSAVSYPAVFQLLLNTFKSPATS